MLKALGTAGEWGAIWVALGLGAAALDGPRRGRWLRAAASAPASIGVNYLVKLAVRRRRPRLRRLPPLAGAPSELSFPVGPRNLVVRGRDRDGPGVARRSAAALCARRRDLRDPPISRHALSVRRAGRRCLRAPDRGAVARGPPKGCRGSPHRPGRRRGPVLVTARRERPRGDGHPARDPPPVKIGIVGLPNAGKTTLFNALTRAGARDRPLPVHHGRPRTSPWSRCPTNAWPGGRGGGGEPGAAGDDRVPRHRGARARCRRRRGARQPLPGGDQGNRRDLPRRARSRRRAGPPPRGQRQPGDRRRGGGGRAPARRPRAGRGSPGAGSKAGRIRRQGGVGGARLAGAGGGGAGRRPAGSRASRRRRSPPMLRRASRRSARSPCSTWRTWTRASRSLPPS